MWHGQGAALLTFPMKKQRLRRAENRTTLRKRSGSCLILCQPLRYDFSSIRLCVSRLREREYSATHQNQSENMYIDIDFQPTARQNLVMSFTFRFAL